MTIRKSLSKSKVSGDSYQVSSNLLQKKVLKDQEIHEVESLKTKLKSFEVSNRTLQQNYEVAINDCELNYETIKQLKIKVKSYEKVVADIHKKDKMIEQYKKDKNTLESELETAEKNWKSVNKTLKTKDKDLHDLYKENVQVSENLVKVKAELNNLTVKVNKEKKDELKNQKKRDKKDFLDNLKPSSHIENFDCEKCDVKTASWNSLKTHDRTCHMNSNSAQTEETVTDDKNIQTSSNEFTCVKETQCSDEEMNTLDCKDWGTKPKFRFEKHLCPSCGKTFPSESHLQDHRQSCHGTKTKFSNFSSSSDLTTFPIGFPSSTAFPFWLPPR